MKKLVFLVIIFLFILVFILANTIPKTQKIETPQLGKKAPPEMATPPPSSLDLLYPPKTEQPVYLFRMLGMATPFVGIMVDLFENEPQNVKANFDKFKVQYSEVSQLVPEWEKDFPIAPLEELEKALENGGQDKVMTAYEKVGKVCHECHEVNMVKVQQKYHWRDFRGIMTKDPLTDEKVNFTQLMQYLNTSFIGIIVDVEQGQSEKAQKQLQGFKARFQAMEETCEECHGAEERKYYIDESVKAMIDELGRTISSSSVNKSAVEKLFMNIGMESCFKCHLVHTPAALAKLQWAK
ncbi:MAG: hypothetical protein GTO16_03545 [Candidatus Aminicenantes bacterium]|nr:hypothetical protein [Candidatus Aminicenantes bacterium]